MGLINPKTFPRVFFIVCVVLFECNALDTITVAPLNSIAPATEKLVEKDAKKIDRFDIAPEFYKGPNANSFDLKYNGNNNRPPIPNFNTNYHNPYLSKHAFFGQHEKYAAKDRVSIGGGSYSSSEFNGNGYAVDRVRPYGSPQPIDLPPNSAQYDPSYDGGPGPGPGPDWNQNGYGHGYGNMWTDKMHHLSKSHFLPLAGAALIGIAAALLVNPVWLQLGTVAGKRRRRRDTLQRYNANEMSAHHMAYNGQRSNKRE